MAKLVVLRGDTVDRKIDLAQLPARIGRAPSNQVVLQDPMKGVSREHAYEWVQRNAMRSFNEQLDFKERLLADADVTEVLPPAAIRKAFDLDSQMRNVDAIFARVFGA